MKKRRKGPSDQKPASVPPAQAGWRAALSGWIGNAEAICLFAAKPFPFQRLSAWITAFFRPSKAALMEQDRASLDRIAGDLFAVYLIYAIVAFVFGAYALYYSSAMQNAASLYGYETPEPLAFAAGTLVASPIINSATALVLLALLGGVASVLGGKASMAGQARALSLIFCGWTLLATVLFVPMMVFAMLGSSLDDFTPAGILLGLATLAGMLLTGLLLILLSLWGIYAYYVAIKEMNGFSGYRAAAVIIVAALAIAIIDSVARGVLGIGF